MKLSSLESSNKVISSSKATGTVSKKTNIQSQVDLRVTPRSIQNESYIKKREKKAPCVNTARVGPLQICTALLVKIKASNYREPEAWLSE